MKKVFQRSRLQFAPGLLQVLQSPTPPDISYFKTLALNVIDLWAVYILVLEKVGQRPRIYIGSGTDSENGVKCRMTTYDTRSAGKFHKTIPHYVETSLKEGYVLTHKGLLVWIALPPASEAYLLRCLFLILECIFTLCFQAMKSRTKDYFMPDLCPWPRDSFTYDGCCGHFSINEMVIGNPASLDMDHGEINRIAAEAKAAKEERKRMSKTPLGPGVNAARCKATRTNNLEEQKFKCGVCVLIFPSQATLDEHQQRPVHIRKVQEQATSGSVNQYATTKGAPLAVINKTHWCEPCKHAARTAERLQTHLNSTRHAKKLRILAASSELA